MSYPSAASQREKSDTRTEIARSLLAVALLLGLFALVAFAPRNDPAKTIAGLPCSVVSENEAAAVLGTPVRLLPSTGSICRYVATTWNVQRSLYVVARHDDDPSLGSGTRQIGRSLSVRRGRHTYVFTIVASNLDEPATLSEERMLANAVQHTVVARTR